MKLIKHEMLRISYLNHLTFTGSHEGIRYLVKNDIIEEDVNGEKVNKNRLSLCTYPDEFSFDNTDDSKKKYKFFEYSEKGIDDLIEYMNEEFKW